MSILVPLSDAGAVADAGLCPTIGRTPSDVIAENTTVSVVLALLAIVLLLVVGAMISIALASWRAQKEGRQFRSLWGLIEIGARDAGPNATTQQAAATGADTGLLLRGALAITRAAHQVALASTADSVFDGEGYLLTTLTKVTSQRQGVTRRASILKAGGSGSGEHMKIHCAYPEALFKKPHRQFMKSDFDKDGDGLCWAAVHACRTPQKDEGAVARNVYYTPDVSQDPAYVSVQGHHKFKSILIAPIIGRRENGPEAVLGVVCLDSDEVDHYSETDHYLVAVTALAIASAWTSVTSWGKDTVPSLPPSS